MNADGSRTHILRNPFKPSVYKGLKGKLEDNAKVWVRFLFGSSQIV